MLPQNIHVAESSTTIEAICRSLVLLHMVLVLMVAEFKTTNYAPSKTFFVALMASDVEIVILLSVVDFLAIFAHESITANCVTQET